MEILFSPLLFISFIVFAVWYLITIIVIEKRINRIRAELDTKVFSADYWKFKKWVKEKIEPFKEKYIFEVWEEVIFDETESRCSYWVIESKKVILKEVDGMPYFVKQEQNIYIIKKANWVLYNIKEQNIFKKAK